VIKQIIIVFLSYALVEEEFAHTALLSESQSIALINESLASTTSELGTAPISSLTIIVWLNIKAEHQVTNQVYPLVNR